jgi:hypothetical protein
MTSSSASLFKEQEQFLKRQAAASAPLASSEKRQKVEKSSSQKTNRPKSTFNRSKTASGLNFSYYHMKSLQFIS